MPFPSPMRRRRKSRAGTRHYAIPVRGKSTAIGSASVAHCERLSGPTSMARVAAQIFLPARGRFDLVATVESGARALGRPWVWAGGRRPVLRRAERLHGRAVHLLEIRPAPGGVVLRAVGPGANEIEQLAPLAARVRRALQLDVDLTDLHRRCHGQSGLAWIARGALGRIVHGTTLFEDCVAALLGDAAMPHLVAYGRRCPELPALRACPTPLDLATVGTRGLRARTGLDRRADAAVRLARAVVAGRGGLPTLDARAASLSRPALLRALRALPGLSSSASATLAPLLGHHERLALDRLTLRRATRVLLPGRPPRAAELRRRLAPLGPWGGLVLALCAARGAATDLAAG
jgi:3-methyladenine DNA glycosylase/8-oxoguanine DNA glycosylase